MHSRWSNPILLTVFILVSARPAQAQPGKDSLPVIANVERNAVYTRDDSVYVLADIYYKKGGTSRWLLGDH
jgi:hypothetical protein